MQQAVQAATAAVQGLAGGNIGQAISGAAAPYLAKVIHDMTTTKDANGKEVVNTQANLMAHAVLGAVVASAQGNSALAGASGAALGEYIAQQMYPGVPKDKLTEEQKQTISALGTLAAGLVGGIAGDSSADAVAGAQAGKNSLENNNLLVVARTGAQACSKVAACRDAIVEKGLGALLGIGAANTVLDNLSASEKEYVFNVAMTGKADLIEQLTPEQREAYDYMVGQDQKGLITIFPQPDRDLTGGKLVNPAQDESKGTTLTTPDQSGQQGASNTGNVDGAPDTGGNILVNPGADPFTKKDVVYLSENSNSKIDGVINETLSGKKNFTSSTTLTSDEALAAGLKFLGAGYKEIGKPGSGVYHSADGTKEFRIDSGSIGGAHAPGVPHVHFGVKNPETGKYISNNHVPYED
jgi:filamentous hemagglutinin